MTAFPGDRIRAIPDRAAGSGTSTPTPAETDTPGGRFLIDEAEEGVAFVRPRGDRTRELEAVFPPGTRFVETGEFRVQKSGGSVSGRAFERAEIIDRGDAPGDSVPGDDLVSKNRPDDGTDRSVGDEAGRAAETSEAIGDADEVAVKTPRGERRVDPDDLFTRGELPETSVTRQADEATPITPISAPGAAVSSTSLALADRLLRTGDATPTASGQITGSIDRAVLFGGELSGTAPTTTTESTFESDEATEVETTTLDGSTTPSESASIPTLDQETVSLLQETSEEATSSQQTTSTESGDSDVTFRFEPELTEDPSTAETDDESITFDDTVTSGVESEDSTDADLVGVSSGLTANQLEDASLVSPFSDLSLIGSPTETTGLQTPTETVFEGPSESVPTEGVTGTSPFLTPVESSPTETTSASQPTETSTSVGGGIPIEAFTELSDDGRKKRRRPGLGRERDESDQSAIGLRADFEKIFGQQVADEESVISETVSSFEDVEFSDPFGRFVDEDLTPDVTFKQGDESELPSYPEDPLGDQ